MLRFATSSRRRSNHNILQMHRWQYRLLFTVGLFTLLHTHISAQDVDYDYRAYKFYKEEYEPLIALEDTLRVEQPSAGFISTIARNSDYALGSLNFRNLGSKDTRQYAIGVHTVDYNTSRLLSQLRVNSDDDEGFGVTNTPSSSLYLRSYNPAKEFYISNSLRAEITGKGYLGGVSFYGSHKPDYHGVTLKEGWQYRYSARLCYGNDAYVQGLFKDAIDLAFNASYSDRRNKLSIILLSPYSNRGLRRASNDEAYTLLNNRLYNPVWGMQSGKPRNSRTATLLRPEAIVSWDYRVGVTTDMSIVANFYHSKESITSLSWFNAPTPIPDNYRYLPSYFTRTEERKPVTEAWLRNDMHYTQIDWEGMYHTNMLQSDGHSRYIVEARNEDISYGGITASFKMPLKSVAVVYGVSFNASKTSRYKTLEDLLGGNHITDLDYYLVDDATMTHGAQNNLKMPNRTVKEGDIFGYYYSTTHLQTSIFGEAAWNYGDMRFGVNAVIATDRLWRNGYFEKEIFAGSGSYGRSQSITQTPYCFTFSWGYTNGGHLVNANLSTRSISHDIDNLFFNPEYNNRFITDAPLITEQSLYISYTYLSERLNRAGVMLFATKSNNNIDILRYYDDIAKVYTNSIISGIAEFKCGLDIRAELRWNKYFSSNFRATIASYRFSNDALVTMYRDSDNQLIARSNANIKGFHIGSSELALYGDLRFSHRGWTTQASISWVDGGYLSPSFTSRSERVISFANSKEERAKLSYQRDLPNATTLDFSLSKRFKYENDKSLVVRFAIRNLLNNSWVYSGYEANRVRDISKEYYSHIERHSDMLNYSYPRTLYLSLTLWL